MADPYTQVYDAIWDTLESSVDFTNLVRVGNRIKFAGDSRAPDKEHVMDADFPEVRVVTSGDVPHPLRTSSHSSVQKTFAIQIVTGDRLLDARIFPVQWAVHRALTNWPNTLGALTWNGEKYVTSFQFTEGVSNVDDDELNRGIAGWSTIWQCTVEMWFATSLMLDPVPRPVIAWFSGGPPFENKLVWVTFTHNLFPTASRPVDRYNFSLRHGNAYWARAESVIYNEVYPKTLQLEFSAIAVMIPAPPLPDFLWYRKVSPEFLIEALPNDREPDEFRIACPVGLHP